MADETKLTAATRLEKLLDNIAGGENEVTPATRLEKFLSYIADAMEGGGGSGGGTQLYGPYSAEKTFTAPVTGESTSVTIDTAMDLITYENVDMSGINKSNFVLSAFHSSYSHVNIGGLDIFPGEIHVAVTNTSSGGSAEDVTISISFWSTVELPATEPA